VTLLNAGIRSRAEIVAARGRDFDEVNGELQADTFRPVAPPRREVINVTP
jgi:hypothetical protein